MHHKRSLLGFVVTVLLVMVGFAQEPSPNPTHDPMIGFKVVFFTADWCAPCKLMRPTVERLHKEGLPILLSRVDQPTPFAKLMKIKVLPTILFLNEGVEVGRIEGSQSYETVLARYNDLRLKYPPEPVPEPDDEPYTPVDENDSGLPFDNVEYNFLRVGPHANRSSSN